MKQSAFLVVFLFIVLSMPLLSAGDVSINIGVALPSLTFAEPPDVVVVPSGTSYVYMVPDTPGIYFYGGYWYRVYGDHWYRSTIYSGPWTYVRTTIVPRVIVDVPPDYYRRLPRGYQRIHYGDLHKHWRTWDRGRHWNRYDWYKHEVRAHEKWRRTEGRRTAGERYTQGSIGHKQEGDVRGPQGDRNRQEGKRYNQGNERRKPQGNDQSRLVQSEIRKSQGDDRRRSVPNQKQEQDRQRNEQR